MSSAAERTEATRARQPLPKVGQIGSRWRKASRASQSMSMTTPAGFARAAASVAGPMRPSWATPSTAWRYFAALPGPLFTAKSKTA